MFRVGKFMEITLKENRGRGSASPPRRGVADASLANTVIEEYRIEIVE